MPTGMDYTRWLGPYIVYDTELTWTTDSYDKNMKNNFRTTKDKCSKKTLLLPGIQTIHFNKDAGTTVVLWTDGTKTIVRCMEGEKFEPYMGFSAAVMKRLFGSTSAAKKAMEDYDAAAIAAKKQAQRSKEVEERRDAEKHNHDRKIRSLAKRIDNLAEALGIVAGAEFDKNGGDRQSEEYLDFEDAVNEAWTKLNKLLTQEGKTNG